MCGIVGAVAQRDVAQILLEGLRRLEYRGYDSAGIAVISEGTGIQRFRAKGKVAALGEQIDQAKPAGSLGIAHTRWATHGVPSEDNAHPHMSNGRIAVVHNGIIENYLTLKQQLQSKGYHFVSETDTEVVAHLVHSLLDSSKDLFEAVSKALKELHGAYALGVIDQNDPTTLIAARQGSPLVIGLGIGENFIASDVFALLPVTQRFIFMQEGDMAILKRDSLQLFDRSGSKVQREEHISEVSAEAVAKGPYRHFMMKEIHEQPTAIANTLEGRLIDNHILLESFGNKAQAMMEKVRHIQIVACGTSYHAGMVGRYWIEQFAGLPCSIEVASEFRYRKVAVPEQTLLVTLSQSGETADTLAALRASKEMGYLGSLSICNVPESSLVRESDLVFMTHAGPEIGVASTKAFTTQLVAMLMLTAALVKAVRKDETVEEAIVRELRLLPTLVESILVKDQAIEEMAEQFVERNHALFLGRGPLFPIALEGALKLKEISYIHAEAYPAGELKHGPLALVDSEMPIVAVAPNDELLDKLKSNLEEVRARGGQLYVFADEEVAMPKADGINVIRIKGGSELLNPITFVVPLQLLSYHVAVLRGTDVDQPRNLAKSVTVE